MTDRENILEELRSRGITINASADWFELLDAIYLNWSQQNLFDFMSWLERYYIRGEE